MDGELHLRLGSVRSTLPVGRVVNLGGRRVRFWWPTSQSVALRSASSGVMMNKTWPFVTCILGTAFFGAALILLIPSLFRPDHGGHRWVAALMGCLAVVFAAGALYLKPHFPVGGDDR